MKISIKVLLYSATAVLFIFSLLATPIANTFAQLVDDAVNPLPDHLKLKAPKDRLIGTKEFSNGDVKYAYRSDVRVSTTPSAEARKQAVKHGLSVTDEIIEQRTPHARTFKTNVDGTYVTEIISGSPQYYLDEGGMWWVAGYGTTTKDAFDRQTIVVALLDNLFGKKALASPETFYPDPDTETSSVDGYLSYGKTGNSWSDTRNASSNANGDDNTVSDSGTRLLIRTAKGFNWNVGRAFVLFDTSALPDDAQIDSASVNLYATSTIVNTDNDGNDYVSILTSTPASNTGLVADDYDQVGSTEQHDASERKDLTSISTGAYVAWDLNATGLGNISVTGVTKFGVREGHDLANDPPSQETNNEISFSSADATDTTQDPKLVVVYTLPPPPVPDVFKVRKSANQSFANTTLLQTDSELVIGLSPNKEYIIEGIIFATSSSVSPDLQIGWNFPSDMTADLGFIAGDGSTFRSAELIQASNTASQSIPLAANTPAVIKISGTVTVGSASSTLAFLWSQASANATPTTVLRGSYLKAEEIE